MTEHHRCQPQIPAPARLAEDTDAGHPPISSVSALDAAQHPRHRWYFFKEGFSPEVVKRATADASFAASDLIVDPFCGSGTVPLQASLDGFSSASLEVNPFLAFVTRTKLLQCRPDTFEARTEDAIRRAKRGRKSPLEGYSTFTRARGASKWLFNISVLRAFEAAYTEVGDARSPAQQLVKLCLIGAAMDTANAVKDGKCLRYRQDWKDQAFDADSFVSAVEARARIVSEDLHASRLPVRRAVVKQGDARKRIPGGKKFKLCVTSPPYLNSFDYTDVYRPELFLGKWVDTTAALRSLRFRTMRSHVQVEWKAPTEQDFGPLYADTAALLETRKHELWNGRIPLMVQAYFEDMRRVLRGLRAQASEDASAWIVVSTSAYAGVEIPVDLIIADIAAASQWYLREVTVLRYLGRVAGQQWTELSVKKSNKPHLRESLIILDARPSK